MSALRKFRRKVFSGPVDPRMVFSRFKEVLESNTRALEIITDMGEKLGGEYIFDIVYVKKSYDELYAAIDEAIKKFNQLTHGRYDVEGVFRGIDGIIRKSIYQEDYLPAKTVLFFDEIGWEAARDAGAKNCRLAELKNSPGLNVPNGFAATSRAYDDYIRHNGIEKKIRQLAASDDRERLSAEIRDAILNGGFPGPLSSDFDRAVSRLKELAGENGFVAVRSSAEEEDGDISFAGQFATVLNVPLEAEKMKAAYKKVIASLFSDPAVSYQLQFGYTPGRMRMPVGFVLMVDAAASGVLYTADPASGEEKIVVNSSWGLGSPVVEGRVGPDVFVLNKGPVSLLESRPGGKEFMLVPVKEGGVEEAPTPAELKGQLSLNVSGLLELAGISLAIEGIYRRPQDIEWALGKDGKFHVLQSRPLRISIEKTRPSEAGIENPVLMKDRGFVVQQGVAAGRVFLLKNENELDRVPKGAILVAKHDSPAFVRVMTGISAIITETGAPASHMASLCREFRLPTVVNAGDATKKLEHGREVTLAAADGGYAIYDGIARELLAEARRGSPGVEGLYEFRKKRYIMRFISMLNLVNPLTDEFTPEKCRTMHDILRFMHEKSVQELIESSRRAGGGFALKKLEMAVPAGIQVVDIGGGLSPETGETAHLDDIESVPFRAILEGMLYPGAWQEAAVGLHARDFLSSMMRMEDITSGGAAYAEKNIAVISREYVNLSLRFGYHFNLVDSFCTERAASNHIYFRFVGGATDISKRSRRIRLIEAVLREYGFVSSAKGDLIVARISNIAKEEALRVLDRAGRLIAFTRQLDAVLERDDQVEEFKRRFLENNFRIG